tara:strand:+ start:62 stop:406 length:345 start_codon:yes stop_codon:yes gene_type:complete
MKQTLTLFLFLGLATAVPVMCEKSIELQPIINNTNCTDCKNFVQFLTNETKIANATIYGLVELVEDICSQIHTPQGDQCTLIVEQIINILNYISKGLSPDNICRVLKYCASIIN